MKKHLRKFLEKRGFNYEIKGENTNISIPGIIQEYAECYHKKEIGKKPKLKYDDLWKIIEAETYQEQYCTSCGNTIQPLFKFESKPFTCGNAPVYEVNFSERFIEEDIKYKTLKIKARKILIPLCNSMDEWNKVKYEIYKLDQKWIEALRIFLLSGIKIDTGVKMIPSLKDYILFNSPIDTTEAAKRIAEVINRFKAFIKD